MSFSRSWESVASEPMTRFADVSLFGADQDHLSRESLPAFDPATEAFSKIVIKFHTNRRPIGAAETY